MTSRNEAEFIGLLYDAALGRASWQTVVAEMATVIEGSTSSLIVHDPLRDRTGILGMHCLTDEYVEVYGSTFFEHDLWTHEALRRRLYNRAVLGVELVTDKRWEQSVIYNDFLRPRTDAFHLVGGMVHLHGGETLAIGCHRPRSARAFSGEHQARLDRLLRHLQRATEIHQRLLEEQAHIDAAQRSLSALSTAMVQVNERGTIVHLNAAAEAILRVEDGLACRRQKLCAASRMEDTKLQALILKTSDISSGSPSSESAGGHLRISRPSGKRAYALSVSPLGIDRVSRSLRHAAALVLIDDPDDQKPINMAALRDLFGLSPAEAQVTADIAAGHSLREIAVRLDVTINTVRTLLARSMAKAETNSQLGLVKLVLAGPAGAHYRKR